MDLVDMESNRRQTLKCFISESKNVIMAIKKIIKHNNS